MADVKCGITVAGSLIADVFHEIDTYPDEGLLVSVRSISQSMGGSGNLVFDLAKLDPTLTVKVCSIVGEDNEGGLLLEKLSECKNIDKRSITVEGRSSKTIVMNSGDTKQRTFFFCPEASDKFDESYINWELADAKIFHLEYLLLMKKVDSPDEEYGTHGARILADAKRRGMITSIDVVSEKSDRAKQVVTAALKYTDICCLNEFETASVTEIELMHDGEVSEDMVKRALVRLTELGVTRWAVIHFPKAAYGYDKRFGEFVYVPSLKLPIGYIKGSTGAGDAYCSGILYGAYNDMTLRDSMLLARAAAAASLSENNGTDGMRSYDEVLALGELYG